MELKNEEKLEEDRKLKDALDDGTGAGGVYFSARICLAVAYCSTSLHTVET